MKMICKTNFCENDDKPKNKYDGNDDKPKNDFNRNDDKNPQNEID
jgi:hypothetical protein